MYTEEDKTKIAELLRDCLQLVNPVKLRRIPGNYAQLKEAALLEELSREVQKLTALFSADAANEEVLKQAFLKLCAEREEQNQGTCMSYTALPEGICNSLYLEIAAVLFKPRHFGELVAILLPGMKASLTAELVFSQTYGASRKAEENLDLALKEEPFAAFANYPAQRSMLTQVVTGDNFVFNLESIANLPLQLRVQFHRLIVRYPALKDKIYKHNDDLQQLLFDLELINKHGATPDEMLLHLSNELLRAGTRFTGNVHAASSVTGSCSQFRHYLDQLPSGLEEKLVAMRSTDGADSLAKVLEHLANANCVEEAAGRIKRIRENPANKELLMSHPGTTREQEYKIQQKYKKAIEVTGFESTNKLPEKLKQRLIRNIRIKSAHDYIDLLLNLPPEEYLTFLTHASITCTPPLPEELDSAINMLNTGQASAFFEALFARKDKFGGLRDLVFLAVRCNQITAKVLQAVPEQELHSLIKKAHTSLLPLAAQNTNPEIWKLFWDQLSMEERLELLNKTDGFHFSPMYYAARNNNPEILRTLLEFIPDQERLTYLKKGPRGHTESPLDVAIKNNNPAILQTIRLYLPAEDYQRAITDKDLALIAKVIGSHNAENMISLIAYLKQHSLMCLLSNKSDDDRKNILHRTAQFGSPEIARILLDALTEQEIKKLLSEKDIRNSTPLETAASNNLDIYIIMMNRLTDNERSDVVSKGQTIAWLVRATPEKWNRIWSLFKDKNKFASLFLEGLEGHCQLHSVSAGHAQIWHDLWGALTPGQRTDFVNRKVLKYKGLLQYLTAEGHFGAWSDVWEFHTENERLAIMGEISVKRETILHYAAENHDLEVTRAILQFLSANNLLTTLNIETFTGATPLLTAVTCNNSSVMFALLELIPAKDRLTALKQKMSESNYSLLHLAAKKGYCWRVVWQLLPADDRSDALMDKSGYGESPLHLAIIDNPQVISFMLSPLSQQERMLILGAKTSLDNTPLYTALECGGQVWSSIWNYMPEQLRLSVIKEKKDGETLLHLAINKNKPELVAAILRLLPAQDRLAALTEKNANGKTPMHLAASCHDNEMLLIMLEYMPQDYLTAIRAKDKDGDSVLHSAKTIAENFYTLLQAVPDGDRLTVLEDKNNSGLNVLNAAITAANQKIFFKIHELLPLNEIVILLKAKDNKGNNSLHTACVWPCIFMIILNILPEDERLLILNEKNKEGNTPLHSIAREWSVERWSELWKSFSDKGRFASLFVEQKNDADVCPLHCIALRYYPTMWNNLWGVLTADQKTAFAMKKIKEGTRLLHIAAQSGCLEIWRQVWAIYSEQERLTAVSEKSLDGFNILHWATENRDVEVSRDIVKFLPKHNLSFMLTERGNDGNTPLHSAIIKKNSRALSVLLESIPAQERLTILKQKNCSGKSPLYMAAGMDNAVCWDVIWRSLPVCDLLALAMEYLDQPAQADVGKEKFSLFQSASNSTVVSDAPKAKI